MKYTNRFSMEAQAAIAFIVAQILFKIRLFQENNPPIFNVAKVILSLSKGDFCYPGA